MIRVTLAILLAALGLNAQAAVMNVQLTWVASTTPAVTYNVYRVTGACSATTSFGSPALSGIAGLTFADNGIAVGTYCYKVSASLSGLESIGNPTVSVSPPSLPATPGGITVIVTIPKGQ